MLAEGTPKSVPQDAADYASLVDLDAAASRSRAIDDLGDATGHVTL